MVPFFGLTTPGLFPFLFYQQLVRFTALTGEERKQVAEIQNEVIVEMAVRLAGTMELQSVKVSVDFSRSGE